MNHEGTKSIKAEINIFNSWFPLCPSRLVVNPVFHLISVLSAVKK
jgi:hypothetical protein